MQLVDLQGAPNTAALAFDLHFIKLSQPLYASGI